MTAGSHLSVTARKKKKGKACWAGGAAMLGQLGSAYARGGETGRRPGLFTGLKKKKERGKGDGPDGGKEREERGKGFSFSFKFLFKFIFQTFKLQSNRNPCIRIMMHKHLLFLNYFSDV
jgi:hypothetical protein